MRRLITFGNGNDEKRNGNNDDMYKQHAFLVCCTYRPVLSYLNEESDHECDEEKEAHSAA